MTPAFLAAVVDTLLPGEASSPDGRIALPSGTAAGVDLGPYREAARPVLQAIADAAGDPQAFVDLGGAGRRGILQAVQREAAEEFARLLALLLPDYYESAQVLRAFGWRTEPPQPLGHDVLAMDEATRRKLERVRLSGQRWRG